MFKIIFFPFGVFFIFDSKKVDQLLSIVDQRNELIELLEEQKEASSIYDSSTDFDISDYRDSEQSTWSLQEKKFPLKIF